MDLRPLRGRVCAAAEFVHRVLLVLCVCVFGGVWGAKLYVNKKRCYMHTRRVHTCMQTNTKWRSLVLWRQTADFISHMEARPPPPRRVAGSTFLRLLAHLNMNVRRAERVRRARHDRKLNKEEEERERRGLVYETRKWYEEDEREEALNFTWCEDV